MKKIFVSLASAALFLSGSIATAGNSELIDDLLISNQESCDDIGIEKERLRKVIKALTAEIMSQSKRGNQVQLDGFGTFYSVRMEAPVRIGMQSQLPVRKVVHFKAHNADWVKGEQSRVTHLLTNRLHLKPR